MTRLQKSRNAKHTFWCKTEVSGTKCFLVSEIGYSVSIEIDCINRIFSVSDTISAICTGCLNAQCVQHVMRCSVLKEIRQYFIREPWPLTFSDNEQ